MAYSCTECIKKGQSHYWSNNDNDRKWCCTSSNLDISIVTQLPKNSYLLCALSTFLLFNPKEVDLVFQSWYDWLHDYGLAIVLVFFVFQHFKFVHFTLGCASMKTLSRISWNFKLFPFTNLLMFLLW